MCVAHKWIVAVVVGLSLVGSARCASAAEVTDADRSFRNYTQETAVVSDQQVRVEVRGVMVQDEGKTRLNLIGYRIKADSIHGGIMDLVGSYGLSKNSELGLILPGYIESRRVSGQPAVNNGDMGDLQLYGKFKYSVAEHCSVGAGGQLSVPTGNEKKEFGTNELGMTPYVSTRYEHGSLGVGVQAGYQFWTGDVPGAFQYGAEFFVRPSESWAFRTEVAGRVFDQGGFRNHDVSLYPGFDYNLEENLVIRPIGIVGLSKIALDYGIGLGVAAKF